MQNIFKSKNSNAYWYKDKYIGTNGYSVAVDDLDQRTYINGNAIDLYKTDNSSKDKDGDGFIDQDVLKKESISAYTQPLKINVENKEDEKEGTNDVSQFLVPNMNFGIIDTPKISLEFEKVMTNIRVTNTSGQVIIDGNPSSKNIKYLSNLDSNDAHLTSGSDYAKIEINDEELYGAKLEITYAIKIKNNSDVNYYEEISSKNGYYYMFGEVKKENGTKEVNITIDQINDYLDSKLSLSGKTKELEECTDDSGKTYLEIKNIEATSLDTWQNLYSSKIAIDDGSGDKRREDGNNFQDTAEITLTRTLSHEDANIDMTFTNQAEVIKIHVTKNPPLVENINYHSVSETNAKYINYFKSTKTNLSNENYLTITPPTGADKMTIIIYIAIAAVAGIIITIGIIVIKKKVLNK